MAAGMRRGPRLLAAVVLVLTCAAVVGTVAAGAVGGSLETPGAVLWALGGAVFAGVGTVVVWTHPRHALGWAFVWAGLLFAVTDLATRYSTLGSERVLPASDLAAWVSTFTWAPSLGLVAVIAALFPTGRPVNRLGAVAAVVAMALTTIIAAVNAVVVWPHRSAALLMMDPNQSREDLPVDLLAANDLVHGLLGVGWPIFMVTVLLTIGTLLLRVRRATGVERQQLKWLGAVAVVMVPLLVVQQLVELDGLAYHVADFLTAPVWLAIAAGVAVLRYRLYDIDLILSRTLSYGVVTAILLGAYSASVVAFGAVARGVTGRSSDLVVALSTLVVAALFQPLRRRVQRVIDQRFNRGHIDGLAAAEDFGRRLREEVELGAVVADLRGTVARTLQPATTSVVTLAPERSAVRELRSERAG